MNFTRLTCYDVINKFPKAVKALEIPFEDLVEYMFWMDDNSILYVDDAIHPCGADIWNDSTNEWEMAEHDPWEWEELHQDLDEDNF